jgi:hypothetical protein
MSPIRDAQIAHFMPQRLNLNFGKMNRASAHFLAPRIRVFLALFLVTYGFWPNWSMAQPSRDVETLKFTIPKTLYFTGEKIWIDAEVLLGTGRSSSQVLYAELVDASANSVDYVKIPLFGGKALNYFKINPSIPSAHYLLRIYTRISPYLDQDKGIAQQFITVINPNLPPKSRGSDQANPQFKPEITAAFPKSSAIGSSFTLPKDKVHAVGFSIANPFLPLEHLQLHSSELYHSLDKKILYPELFGHIVEVKVPNSEPNATYFLSVHGKQSALYTDIPDENGTLIFDTGGLRHWDRLIVQLGDGSEMPGIEVISPVIKTTFNEKFDFPLLTLNEEDLSFLKKLIKAAQVESYFKEEFSKDSVGIVTGFVADHIFNLDDYTRFDNIETVLREYVPSVLVRTRDRKKEFRLMDQAGKRVFDTNPLILIDAMPVFDSELLASFNPKFMQRLEVLNREFYLNERIYPGVMSFSSYGNNFGLFPLAPNARFFDYLGLQPMVNMDRRQFADPSNEERIPDWRTILYWNNHLNGVAEIQAPDLEGLFLFWVKSVDEEGKDYITRTYYSIRP